MKVRQKEDRKNESSDKRERKIRKRGMRECKEGTET